MVKWSQVTDHLKSDHEIGLEAIKQKIKNVFQWIPESLLLNHEFEKV